MCSSDFLIYRKLALSISVIFCFPSTDHQLYFREKVVNKLHICQDEKKNGEDHAVRPGTKTSFCFTFDARRTRRTGEEHAVPGRMKTALDSILV